MTTNPVEALREALREALKADDRNTGKPYADRHAHLKYAVECWLNDNRAALSARIRPTPDGEAVERVKAAISAAPSLDENGYICTKDVAIRAALAAMGGEK